MIIISILTNQLVGLLCVLIKNASSSIHYGSGSQLVGRDPKVHFQLVVAFCQQNSVKKIFYPLMHYNRVKMQIFLLSSEVYLPSTFYYKYSYKIQYNRRHTQSSWQFPHKGWHFKLGLGNMEEKSCIYHNFLGTRSQSWFYYDSCAISSITLKR